MLTYDKIVAYQPYKISSLLCRFAEKIALWEKEKFAQVVVQLTIRPFVQ